MSDRNFKDKVTYSTVGPDNSVYISTYDGEWVLEDWVQVTSGSVSQAVVVAGPGDADDQIIYGLDLGYTVCAWDSSNERWYQITPQTLDVTQFVIDGEDVYGLGKKDNSIWKSTTSGADWVKLTKGNMIEFTVSDGYFYGVDRNKCVYRQPIDGSGKWEKQTSGSVTQVVVSNGIIYGLDSKSKINVWTGEAWDIVSDTEMVSFMILEPYIYGMNKDKAVFKYPVPPKWMQCTTEFPSDDKKSDLPCEFSAMRNKL